MATVKKPAKKSTKSAKPLAKAAPKAAGLATFTTANFQIDVLESDDLVVVDFWAPWCGPCKMVAPVLADIADSYKRLTVGKLDIDKHPDTADKYKVQTIPTLLLFKGGKQVGKIVGVDAGLKRELEALLKKHL